MGLNDGRKFTYFLLMAILNLVLSRLSGLAFLWGLAAYHIRIIQTTEMMMPMPQRQASAISNCRSRD